MDQDSVLTDLNGTVDSVIYKNEENGYTVLRLRDGNGETVTVVGCFPYAAQGETMLLSGSWTTHAVHGRQFKAEFAQRLMPTDASAIYEYLAGGSVKGVGPATASLIVNRFGAKSLDVIENEPEKLAEIKGISLAKAGQISRSFIRQAGVRRLMEFVCSFGLRPILAMRMYKYYGDDALNLLQANPYILASQHIGGGFSEADALAMAMGMDEHSRSRINAALIFELNHNTGNGHVFIPREKLAAATAQLIGVSSDEADESVSQLIDANLVVQDEIAGLRAVYLPELFEAETDAAKRLARMSRTRYEEEADPERLIARLEKQQQIRYAAMQRRTLQMALDNQVLVITGGPGTGKTTSIRAILALFDELGIRALLTAPTGRAAKRMTELTGREAATVHRLLGAKFDDDGEKVVFTKGENDRLDCDAVILDECSMVDILLMDALLRAMPDDARLILVGDADQLPSVGPGNVFSAVIRSGAVPTVRLTEIFRQNEDSRIVRNAHLINKGEHPNLSENAGDFFRLKRLEAGAALNPPAKDKKEKLFGEAVFRVGDRVMQVRNNYDMLWRTADNSRHGTGVYNGDIGRVAAMDMDAETLTVDFDGRLAEYGFDSLLELEHAWAMTVHKAQGSEYRAVILCLTANSQMLMTRDVLYTAVTRAKELLILVGDDSAAYRMIDNFRQSRRYSALRLRLCALCGV